MMFDLNKQSDFTKENVAKLIASASDATHSQLCVRRDGVVYISSNVGKDHTDDLAFRIETWIAGNGYVGPAASTDDEWVSRVYEALKANWPNPSSSLIDVY